MHAYRLDLLSTGAFEWLRTECSTLSQVPLPVQQLKSVGGRAAKVQLAGKNQVKIKDLDLGQVWSWSWGLAQADKQLSYSQAYLGLQCSEVEVVFPGSQNLESVQKSLHRVFAT